MTQQHPITPPPELVEDWIEIAKPLPQRPPNPGELATLAARWGANQELDACCEWVSQFNYDDYSYQERLRAARRCSKPPSLKAQALVLSVDECVDPHGDYLDNNALAIIRRAIESLPD
jgi:hypothetical protein